MLDITKRNILVFDIETVGDSIDELPEVIVSYLMEDSDTEEKKQSIIENLAFNPLTSSIAAIGMLELHNDMGYILVNTGGGVDLSNTDSKFSYKDGTEIEVLTMFWEILKERNYNLFVTFNGREFDCPYIILRSIYNRIKPSVNLMRGTEYNFKENHIDLLKEFTFYKHSGRGPMRKFTLDFYCYKFGIRSPKIEGISGDKIGELYKERKFQEIADYCISDVRATSELFNFWNEYLNL